ncbi:MAG: hypothetical protein AAFR42_18525, partial [Cyanobacteria bacterium J06628_6]
MTLSPMTLWTDWGLQASLVLLWLGIVGGLSELARRRGYGAELTRKIVHIGAGQVILLAWWLQVPSWMGVTAAAVAATLSDASAMAVSILALPSAIAASTLALPSAMASFAAAPASLAA